MNIKDILITDDEAKLLNVNLHVKNPNRRGEFEYREPIELIGSVVDKEKQIMQLMKEIQNTINTPVSNEA